MTRWDEEEFEDEEVLENAAHCPACDDVTANEILNEKAKGSGTDYLLRCVECSEVHTLQVRAPPALKIPFILSEGAHSERIFIDIDADEEFTLEDVFEESDMLWTINQIELKNGKKARYSVASEVAIISAIRSDMVRVKLTLTRGEYSDNDVLTVPQETTFTADTLMEHKGETWRIRAIHTGAGRTLKGTVEAPDIKRIYLHEPPKPEHFAPRTPRERRQAWKEGKLGHNPNPIRPANEIKKRVQPSNKRKKKQARK